MENKKPLPKFITLARGKFSPTFSTPRPVGISLKRGI